MRKATVKAGQNLGDIAVQYCGDHQAIFELARLNNLSVTDDVAAGSVLILPDVVEKRVRRVYVDGNYYPATDSENINEGIGYWGIEIDFIVS